MLFAVAVLVLAKDVVSRFKTKLTKSQFLIPRVPGTDGNKKVQDYIIKTFSDLNWHIEQDTFRDETPYGKIPFKNIIVTKDLKAQRRIVLAAHFDSKYFGELDFIGATDSAAPCAILMNIAKSLNPYLEKRLQTMDRFTTIQIIFFDGEEAFKTWSDTDSIYGARHLAKLWESRMVHFSDLIDSNSDQYTNPLQQMDVMLLLDLLGTKDVTIPNTHPESTWMYDRLVDIQYRLVRWKLVSEHLRKRVKSDNPIFSYGMSAYGPHAIADDHLPFYNRGVPIVHCIAIPFPSVWHTMDDNKDCLDLDTIKDLTLIFKIAVMEYLGLSKYMD
ncbi:hypothetical protein EDD86DRAFT_251822 [Gorgonomyces haynaldii]|nr:hypothetical protein EDD86DRAFT_251822 [Gorgonomyces haynaldii]